jgi:hypothetical protein
MKNDMALISRGEAIERGLVRYFTGSECKHGHTSERYTITGGCCDCLDASNKARREHIMAARQRAQETA